MLIISLQICYFMPLKMMKYCFLSGLDVSRALLTLGITCTDTADSILLIAYKRGTDPSVVRAIPDMYRKLNARVRSLFYLVL